MIDSTIQEVFGDTSSATALQQLAEEYSGCTACSLHRSRTQVVPGKGHPNAVLFVLGEGPGITEDRTGIPFDGPAGRCLEAALMLAGSTRDEIWTGSTVQCIPKNSRGQGVVPPTKSQAEACSHRLHQEIYAVDPRVVLALGTTAIRQLVGAGNMKVTTAAGKHFRMEFPGNFLPKVTYPAIAAWHPAGLLRHGHIKLGRDEEGNPTVEPIHRIGQEWLAHVSLAVRLSRIPRSFEVRSTKKT